MLFFEGILFYFILFGLPYLMKYLQIKCLSKFILKELCFGCYIKFEKTFYFILFLKFEEKTLLFMTGIV